MKKTVCAVVCIALILGLGACGASKGNVDKVMTHDVESDVYSKEDIKAAVDLIINDFQTGWDGCTLTEIYYAGDDVSYGYKDWAVRNAADEVIVLRSSFDVDSSSGNGTLNPNSTYSDWNWILVRTNGGEWRHVDHGY